MEREGKMALCQVLMMVGMSVMYFVIDWPPGLGTPCCDTPSSAVEYLARSKGIDTVTLPDPPSRLLSDSTVSARQQPASPLLIRRLRRLRTPISLPSLFHLGHLIPPIPRPNPPPPPLLPLHPDDLILPILLILPLPQLPRPQPPLLPINPILPITQLPHMSLGLTPLPHFILQSLRFNQFPQHRFGGANSFLLFLNVH